MSELDNYYSRQQEPNQSCLLAIRNIILSLDKEVSSAWKYGMPFFCYKGKMFCYLWVHKKYKKPYLGIVEGKRINDPELIIEKRARMKIMLFDPTKDLPIKKIKSIVNEALSLYKTGIVKV